MPQGTGKWRLLLATLSLSLLLRLQASTAETIDATSIESFSTDCNGGLPPEGVGAVLVEGEGGEDGNITVSWDPVAGVQGYQLLYRPSCSSQFGFTSVAVGNEIRVFDLGNLLRFAAYIFVVRAECEVAGGGVNYSAPSNGVRVQTPPTAPGVAVQELVVDAMVGGVRGLVNVSWAALPEEQWNGVPQGYYIYLFRLSNPGEQEATFTAPYPTTSYLIGLTDGEYAIQVVPVNDVDLGPLTRSRDFLVGQNSTLTQEDRAVLDYPYIYIIIPGLFCIVIIVVVTIVVFKKAVENRAVSYVQDLESKLNGNAIPLNNLPLHSPSISVSVSVAATTTPSNATATAASMHSNNNPLAQRPLPLSPHPENQPIPPQSFQFNNDTATAAATNIQAVASPPGMGESGFGNGLAPNHQVPRKLPHPGPQPKLLQDPPVGKLEGGGAAAVSIPMTRTLTSQSMASSVFGPVVAVGVGGGGGGGGGGSVIVQSQTKKPPPQATRGRAKTVSGGMPSPYEVPEGSTISRSDGSSSIRSNSAHQQRTQQIPPPPAHSPPPLTHSSMEMRAYISDKNNRQPKTSVPMMPGGQNTLPRAMSQQRSYSSSHAENFSTAAKQMKSEGNLPILETSEEKLVYIRPPLDSSVENSIHSSSSYSGGGEGGRGGGSDRGSANSNRHYHPYSDQTQQQQQMVMKNGNMAFSPGGMNGSMTSSEHFSSYSEATTNPGSLPPPPSNSSSQQQMMMALNRLPPPPSSSAAHHHPTILEHQEREMQPHHNVITIGGGIGGPQAGRESIFSETSTELSISSTSGSLRETSPGFSWEQHPRGGVASDVGMGMMGGAGQRRRRSHSPERETFSDVGGAATHHVFKKASHRHPPSPTAYTSPASITSSTAAAHQKATPRNAQNSHNDY